MLMSDLGTRRAALALAALAAAALCGCSSTTQSPGATSLGESSTTVHEMLTLSVPVPTDTEVSAECTGGGCPEVTLVKRYPLSAADGTSRVAGDLFCAIASSGLDADGHPELNPVDGYNEMRNRVYCSFIIYHTATLDGGSASLKNVTILSEPVCSPTGTPTDPWRWHPIEPRFQRDRRGNLLSTVTALTNDTYGKVLREAGVYPQNDPTKWLGPVPGLNEDGLLETALIPSTVPAPGMSALDSAPLGETDPDGIPTSVPGNISPRFAIAYQHDEWRPDTTVYVELTVDMDVVRP